MIAKSDAASIFRDTRGSRSIEISVPGAFTAVGFSGQQKNPGASAAERGRPSLFKTIDEDRRERHDHINRSGRSTPPTVPWRASPARSVFTVLTVFAAPLCSVSVSRHHTTEAVSSPARKAKPLGQRLLFPTFYSQRPSMSPPSRGCCRRFFRDRARRVIFAAAPQSLDKIGLQISVSRNCSSSGRDRQIG